MNTYKWRWYNITTSSWDLGDFSFTLLDQLDLGSWVLWWWRETDFLLSSLCGSKYFLIKRALWPGAYAALHIVTGLIISYNFSVWLLRVERSVLQDWRWCLGERFCQDLEMISIWMMISKRWHRHIFKMILGTAKKNCIRLVNIHSNLSSRK